MITLHDFLHIFTSHELETAINNEDWNSVTNICEIHPRQARQWSHQLGYYDGKFDSYVLPIHHAMTLSPTIEALESLIRSFPPGLESKDTRFKRIPLHLACIHSESLEIIRRLLIYFPEGASQIDELGRTPLHYTCSNGADTEVVRELISKYPFAASIADKDGWIPLHVAIDGGAPCESIELLIQVYPKGCLVATKKGNIPRALLIKRLQGKQEFDRISTLLDEHENVEEPNLQLVDSETYYCGF